MNYAKFIIIMIFVGGTSANPALDGVWKTPDRDLTINITNDVGLLDGESKGSSIIFKNGFLYWDDNWGFQCGSYCYRKGFLIIKLGSDDERKFEKISPF